MRVRQENLFEKALLADRPIVLEGGLATQLEAQGFDIGSRLWSAGLLQSNPAAIVEAHRAYLEAGAEIICTASYQASREGFMSHGLSEQESDDLIVRAVDLTCEARQQFLDANPDSSLMPIVAASMGPYGAMLHNGSEYTGHYDIDETSLRNFHKTRLQLLDHTNADVLAFETIPNKLEARVLCDLLTNVRLPAWVSFSCRDERRISDGTRLQDASAIFRKHPRVLAVGVNCTAPRLISSLIQEAREGVPDKAIIVYPNSGETYDVTTNAWFGTANPDEVAAAAQIWRSAGAKIIGGCCRIGPRHIDTLRRQLAL